MDDEMSESSEYVHGSSLEEQHRLSLLNDILNESCLRELNLRPGEKVLDVGCGLGQFARLMAQTVGGQADVVGIERNLDQIEQARKLAEGAGEAGLVEFRQGDAKEMPLSSSEWGSFDVAHARFLLEHVPRPGLVVEQMARSVRAGGRVILCDDDHGDFRPWPEPPGFRAIWRAYIGTFEALGNDPYIGRRLVSLLVEAGLTPVRNGGVFFGGCAGDDRFGATADNLIAAFLGAKDAMLSGDLLDEEAFNAGIDELLKWKAGTSSALWYSACFAEGIVPN